MTRKLSLAEWDLRFNGISIEGIPLPEVNTIKRGMYLRIA